MIALAQQPAPTIQIVEGDGALNSIRLHRGVEPVVRVLSPDGEPLSGATVTFVAPSTGPGATFGDSGVSLTVQTDDRGMARGRGLRPNSVAGQFRIRVTTSWRGAPAAANVLQTNAEPVEHAGRTKKIAIIAVIAGAAIGGAAAAAGGKSSSSAPASGTTAATTPPGSIVSGTPAIGPPH